MSEDTSDLLEYETETEDAPEPLAPIDPVPVIVQAPVVTVGTVPQHISAYTVVVDTDTDRVAELLPLDALRVRATIIVHDQPVVLCHTMAQALSATNRATGVPTPSGAFVQASADHPAGPIVLHGTQPMWVAATWDQPARISVLVERRTP